MPKYRVTNRPTGLINAQPWPEVGDTIDLPEAIGDGMGDFLERAAAKVEKRPTSTAGVETRQAAKKTPGKRS